MPIKLARLLSVHHYKLGSEAKPTRSGIVQVELIFSFCVEKKPGSYPLRYIEYFFLPRKSEERL